MEEVVIVGGFIQRTNGATGGVLFASKSLIESQLSTYIKWIKIDSTTRIPIENVVMRGFRAFIRLLKLISILFFRREVKTILLFVSDGTSFIEKGLMCYIGKIMGKRVVLAPRSGYIKGQINNHFFKKYVISVLKKADYVVCQGSNWKIFFEELCNEKDSSRFVIIPNWIEFSKYENVNRCQDKNKPFTILYLGWMTYKKGIFDLIEAIEIIKNNIQPFKVIMAGDGIDRKKAETEIDRKDLNIFFEFTGWVNYEKKLKLFNQSDIFVLASHAEGFPNSLLEAMASGLPVIATDVGAVSELVNAMTGFIIEPYSPQKIAECILKYYNYPELRVEKGINARKRVKENFSIEIAMESFKKILL